MFTLGLPIDHPIETSEVTGALSAFESRENLSLPLLLLAEQVSDESGVPTPAETNELSNPGAGSRRSKRTFKGFQDVAKSFQGKRKVLKLSGWTAPSRR